MKIEITKEDYNDILMAIAVAGASMGSGFRMEYEVLRQKIEDAWERAIEEEVLTRIARAKSE